MLLLVRLGLVYFKQKNNMYIYFHSLIVYMYRTVNRFFIVNVFIKLSVEIDREDIQLHFEKKINACVCMVLIGYIALC